MMINSKVGGINMQPVAPLLMWQLTDFSKLSGYQVYHIIQAREQVFVEDQRCVYVDADGLDVGAMHLSAYQDHQNKTGTNPQLVAYCRILKPAIEPSYPIIGRVLVVASYRGYGLARELMIRAIDYCHKKYPKQPIHLSAQTYLIAFYQSLGFDCDGSVYSANGIEHIHMILAVRESSDLS